MHEKRYNTIYIWLRQIQMFGKFSKKKNSKKGFPNLYLFILEIW